jgi:hypothetical protein
MKRITIRLDEDAADWACLYATRRNMSLSQLVGEALAARMQELSGYEAAKQAWLARSPKNLSSPNSVYPHRDVLHDRRG